MTVQTPVQISDPTDQEDSSELAGSLMAVVDQILPGLMGGTDQEHGEDPAIPEDDPADDQAEKDAQLISDFMQDIRRPEDDRKLIDEMGELRRWVHTEVMEQPTIHSVGMNLVIRNQYIRCAQVQAKSPDWSCQPRKMIPPKDPGPPPPFPRPVAPTPPDPGTKLTPEIAAGHDQLIAQSQAWKEWDQNGGQEFMGWLQFHDGLTRYADTCELLVKDLADQAGLGECLEGVVQDVQTDGLCWVKVVYVEDFGKDPLTANRPSDFSEMVARLAVLVADFEEGNFTEQDGKYTQMRDLADSVRLQMSAEQAATGQAGDSREEEWANGVPTTPQIEAIPRARQFVASAIAPEDMFRDWNITRPEAWRKGRRMIERHRMTMEDIKANFGLSDDDLNDMSPTASHTESRIPQAETDSSNQGIVNEDAQQIQQNASGSDTLHVVWERYELASRRRYVWIDGYSKFLINEVYNTTSRYFYPYFLFYFNRVTGRFMPLSDAKLQRPFNEEYNLLRTHDRAAKRASYNKYVVPAGLLTDEEKEKLEGAQPEAVIELQNVKEVEPYLKTIVGSNYTPEKYDATKCRRDMDETANVPASARGDTKDAAFATSDQIANQTMNEQSDRYRGLLERGITEIGIHILDIANDVLPESHVKSRLGPGAVFPEVDRQTMWAALVLEVVGGSMSKPNQARNLDLWKNIGVFLQSIGVGMPGSPWQPNAPELLELVLDGMNIRKDPKELLTAAPPPMPPMGPPGAGTPPGGPPHGPPGHAGPHPNGPPKPNGPPAPHAPPALIPGGSP